jgi:hypothetical protein
VRSVLPQVPGGGSLPQLPQPPQLPPVQPPPVQPGAAPGVSVPPQVADPVNGVVGGMNSSLQGGLP